MPTYKHILTAIATLAVANSIWATPASDALLEKLKKTYPAIAFSEVRETVAPGIYEAVFGKDVLYVEPSGTYFFPTMVNMVTKKNYGEDRRAELNKIDFSKLPMADAIKTVYGNGQSKFAVFADPNCGYCKKLESSLTSLKDATVYTFPVAILGQDSVTKVTSLECATGDKSKLWHAMLTDGAKPVTKTCANGAAGRNLELFKSFGFQGTPSLVFENGSALKGYADIAQIETAMVKK